MFIIARRCGAILYLFIKHLGSAGSGPRYWRKVIEDASGGIIKLAQILALRYDLLPGRYCKEFSDFFDREPPLSKEEIRKVFQEERGKLPEDIFETFFYEPRATASFGQVHRASLEGVMVAVKVQKPDLRPKISADLAIIKFFSLVADLFLANVPVSLRDAVREWESWTLKELDYLQEARNAERFRNTNVSPYVYIPKTFKAESTSRILVTEFLEGPNLNEIHKSPHLVSDRQRELIARYLIWSNLLHYFKGGFFHADPHLGNLILLRDGRLGVVDFGIMGEAGSHHENYHFAHFMKCAAEGRTKEATDHFSKFMINILPKPYALPRRTWRKKSVVRIERGIKKFLEHKFGSIINDWSGSVGKRQNDLAVRSTARYFLSIVSTARRFGLEIPVNLLAFIRATIIADMVCLVLNPNFDMKEEIRQFFARHNDVCTILEETMLKENIVLTPQLNADADESIAEKQLEEKNRILERYMEYTARAVERILEEGSRGLAYFSTTKI